LVRGRWHPRRLNCSANLTKPSRSGCIYELTHCRDNQGQYCPTTDSQTKSRREPSWCEAPRRPPIKRRTGDDCDEYSGIETGGQVTSLDEVFHYLPTSRARGANAGD